MQQHPVPQHISSYEFRLIGDMTLKQFFQVAAGFLISLLFYASPLPGVIKWFFIIFFALMGLALAFLPFEGRPLEMWILAFFRAIYSPTQYFWASEDTSKYYAEEAGSQPTPATTNKQQEVLTQYTTQDLPKDHASSSLEKQEQSFLQKVASISQTPTILTPTTRSAPSPIAQPEQKGIKIPTTDSTKITYKPQVVPQKQTPLTRPGEPQQAQPQSLQSQSVNPMLARSQVSPLQEAQFSTAAAPPTPPTTPNLVVGQVLDSKGKILEKAILEIKDLAGRPVRATRSNAVGHFQTVTPLLNGKYTIEAEYEGHAFDKSTFEANGKIIPPILITAKPNSTTQAVPPHATQTQQATQTTQPLTN